MVDLPLDCWIICDYHAESTVDESDTSDDAS